MSKRLEPHQVIKCLSCPYATINANIVFCPFVKGSCAKVPSTIETPNQTLLNAYERFTKKEDLK